MAYHVVPELVVQEVSGNMSRQQIEKDPLVAVLQGVHVSLFLVRLPTEFPLSNEAHSPNKIISTHLHLPQKIKSSSPLHLASVDQNSNGEHDDVYHSQNMLRGN
jgi:hypothetical protein